MRCERHRVTNGHHAKDSSTYNTLTICIECRNELMRVGKIIDKMIEPVLKEAEHNIEHGLLSYSDERPCAGVEAKLRSVRAGH